MHFLADYGAETYKLFNLLDKDSSGEITLEEIDRELDRTAKRLKYDRFPLVAFHGYAQLFKADLVTF